MVASMLPWEDNVRVITTDIIQGRVLCYVYMYYKYSMQYSSFKQFPCSASCVPYRMSKTIKLVDLMAIVGHVLVSNLCQ